MREEEEERGEGEEGGGEGEAGRRGSRSRGPSTYGAQTVLGLF